MSELEFNQKVMVFSSKFYGYSYKILGNREEARDTVQDLFLKLWSLRHSLKDVNNIEAFATTIIRNLCIDRLKKIKNSSLHSENLGRLWLEDETKEINSLNDDSEIKVELVRRAIKKLPEIHQRIFIMRDIEEKEFDKISAELKVTPENVRVILSRARKRVRELVANKRL